MKVTQFISADVAFPLITEADIKFINRNHCSIGFKKNPNKKIYIWDKCYKNQLISKALRFATNE